jgi:hypothetical protein
MIGSSSGSMRPETPTGNGRATPRSSTDTVPDACHSEGARPSRVARLY